MTTPNPNSEEAFEDTLETLGESHFEYWPVGTTGEWPRFKSAVIEVHKAAIQAAELSLLERLLAQEWSIDGYESVVSASVLYQEIEKRSKS